jgi:hypothetical protein
MALEAYTGAVVKVSAGCCGESGMGAFTTPEVYNVLRERKRLGLVRLLPSSGERQPVLVGCPSCKQGIGRVLLALHERRRVLHTAEWLGELVFKGLWGERWLRILRRNALLHTDGRGLRRVDVGLTGARSAPDPDADPDMADANEDERD